MTDTATDVRRVPFMFLGGPLDHSTRRIEVTDGLFTPVDEVFKQPLRLEKYWMVNYPHLVPKGEYLTYHRTRCTAGGETWWAYVLEGYQPTRGELLDARPLERL